MRLEPAQPAVPHFTGRSPNLLKEPMNVSRPAVFLALVIAAGLAACETPVPKPVFPDLTYRHLPPIRLAVARIEVVPAYVSPAKKPNVEHLFPVAPAVAAARWLRERLQAAGGRGLVRATVVQGGVVEVPLKKTAGLKGVFTVDQSERYDAVLEVRIRIIREDGSEAAMVSSRAERSRTVAEDITLYAREKIWFAMTEAMMNDLNADLERQIRTYFKAHLR